MIMVTAQRLLIAMMTQALLWVAPSMIILNSVGKRVPLDLKGFGADLKRYAGLLVLFLLHRSISHSMAQVLFLQQAPTYYRALLGLWLVGVPALALTRYVAARKIDLRNRRLLAALVAGFYVVDAVGLFAVVARHNMGWGAAAQSGSQGLAMGQLLSPILLGLAYYAWVSLVEELFFRVALFELLAKWRVTAEATVVTVTGVLFGIVHLTQYFQATSDVARLAATINVVSTTVLGLIFGLVYNRSRNLLHVSFLHWWVWVSNIGAQVLFYWLWY